MNRGTRVAQALSVLLVDAEDHGRPLRHTLEAGGHAVWTIRAAEVASSEVVELIKPDVALVRVPGDRPDAALAAAHVLQRERGIPVVVHASALVAGLVDRLAPLCPRGVLVEPVHPAQLEFSLRLARCSGAPAVESDSVGSPAQLRSVMERIRDLLASVGVGQVEPVGASAPDLSELTQREREVLDAFVRLRRIPDVAESLYISKHTVRNHLKSVYAKLGVHSQPELMVLMLAGERNAD
jgi:DNA-binding NarL/FixJ family response regulator